MNIAGDKSTNKIESERMEKKDANRATLPFSHFDCGEDAYGCCVSEKSNRCGAVEAKELCAVLK